MIPTLETKIRDLGEQNKLLKLKVLISNDTKQADENTPNHINKASVDQSTFSNSINGLVQAVQALVTAQSVSILANQQQHTASITNVYQPPHRRRYQQNNSRQSNWRSKTEPNENTKSNNEDNSVQKEANSSTKHSHPITGNAIDNRTEFERKILSGENANIKSNNIGFLHGFETGWGNPYTSCGTSVLSPRVSVASVWMTNPVLTMLELFSYMFSTYF